MSVDTTDNTEITHKDILVLGHKYTLRPHHFKQILKANTFSPLQARHLVSRSATYRVTQFTASRGHKIIIHEHEMLPGLEIFIHSHSL